MKRMKKIVISILTLMLLFTSVVNTDILARQEVEYYPTYTGSSVSIVDILKSYGVDSSFSSREELAAINNIQQYRGSSQQNNLLVSKAKNGSLIKRVYEVDDSPSVQTSNFSQTTSNVSYFPRYSGSSGSLVDALRAVGVDSSFSNRHLIASANGFGSYRGTSTENVSLLNKLKNGVLVKPSGTQAKPQPQPTTNYDNNKSQPNTNEQSSSTSSTGNEESFQCKDYSDCTQYDNEIYEVTKNNVAVRIGCYEEEKVLERLNEGTLVSVTTTVKNSKNNKWMIVQYNTSNGVSRNAFIYSGNLKKHKHTYTTVYSNKEGSLKTCKKCSYSVIKRDGKTVIVENLVSALRQGTLGDYSNEYTIPGLVLRIAIGEAGPIGVAADARDLIYDVTNDAPLVVIGMDLLAFVPILGVLKHIDGVKYADDAVDVLKHGDEVTEIIKVSNKIGKYKVSDRVYEIFLGVNTSVHKNVQGTHNMARFLELLSTKGDLSDLVDFYKTKKSKDVEGIYELVYRTSVNENFTVKTLYDPRVFSDQQMIDYCEEALNKPKKSFNYNSNEYVLKGTSKNGINFKATSVDDKNFAHFYIEIGNRKKKAGITLNDLYKISNYYK